MDARLTHTHACHATPPDLHGPPSGESPTGAWATTDFFTVDRLTDLKITGGYQRPTSAARSSRSRRLAPGGPKPQGKRKDAPRSETNKYRGVRGESVLTSRFLQVAPRAIPPRGAGDLH